MFEVDARGKRCPAPILEIAQALKEHPLESEFLLQADDPATSTDIAAWARMTGNFVEEKNNVSFYVRRRSD